MGKQTPAEPHLEGRVDVRFWLFSNALVNQDGGYDLRDVSGKLVERMKLPDGYDADLQRDLRFSRKALSVFDRRFPDLYRELRISSRSEEHTSELQSLMRISYAVF